MGVEYTCDRCGKKINPKDFNHNLMHFDFSGFEEAFGQLKKPLLCKLCLDEFNKAYEKFVKEFIEKNPKRFF